MTTPVIVTLIICGTLIVLSAISTVRDIIKRKNARSSFLNFINDINKKK